MTKAEGSEKARKESQAFPLQELIETPQFLVQIAEAGASPNHLALPLWGVSASAPGRAISGRPILSCRQS